MGLSSLNVSGRDADPSNVVFLTNCRNSSCDSKSTKSLNANTCLLSFDIMLQAKHLK